ncbi:MAG: hypothetical protein ACHQT6_05090 [Candidatus Acidiferrales bacterium]
MRQQVFQTVRLCTKNDDCDVSAGEVLLIFDALIHGEEDVKSGCFRCRKKVAIFQTCQTSVTGSLAIVTAQGVPESLIDTFVDQNAHLGTRE